MSDSFTVPKTGIYKISSSCNYDEVTFEYLIYTISHSRKYVNLDRKWYQVWKPKYVVREFYIYDRTESENPMSLNNKDIVVPKMISAGEMRSFDDE